MASEIKRLNIRSAHRFVGVSGEEEINTTDTDCELSRRGDSLLIRYTESAEGAICSVRIHYSKGRLTVKREGAINSCLEFSEGVSERGVYDAGGYLFDTEVYTKSLDADTDGGRCEIRLSYDMKIGDIARTSDMVIRVS